MRRRVGPPPVLPAGQLHNDLNVRDTCGPDQRVRQGLVHATSTTCAMENAQLAARSQRFHKKGHLSASYADGKVHFQTALSLTICVTQCGNWLLIFEQFRGVN